MWQWHRLGAREVLDSAALEGVSRALPGLVPVPGVRELWLGSADQVWAGCGQLATALPVSGDMNLPRAMAAWACTGLDTTFDRVVLVWTFAHFVTLV